MNTLRAALVLLSAFLLTLPSLAQPMPPGRVFYAPFDESFDALQAAGDVHGEPEGSPSLVPGRAGKGLLVGDIQGSAGVRYETAGNLSLERGSLSLWVKPLNWQGDDKLNHLFFSAWPGEKGLLNVYKYATPSMGLLFFLDADEAPRAKQIVNKAVPPRNSRTHCHV